MCIWMLSSPALAQLLSPESSGANARNVGRRVFFGRSPALSPDVDRESEPKI
jgi:hypothetical protein